jgi:hypothetical protein
VSRNLDKNAFIENKSSFSQGLSMKKEIPIAAIISILLVTALSGALSGLNLYQTKVKADDSGYHPNTLFEIPNEIRVEFYAASNEVPKFYNASEPSTHSYPFGEIVYLMLRCTRLRGGDFPAMANVTLIVSDSTGNVVWTRYIGPFGEATGLVGAGGGGGLGVPWVPDALGNYTAGVVFEGLIYDVPNDFSNVISIEICRSSLIFGKVTEKDEITAISTALVEALVDGVQKTTTIADSQGAYTLTLKPESVYDIQASAPGYIPVIQRGISTELESQCLNFSLTPITPDLNTSSPKTTSAFIILEPSVAEVNQTVRINMFVEPPPPTSADVFRGIVLTITSPNGQVELTGPYSTNPNGSQHIFFTPVQSGNYTFQFHYPGQVFNSEEIEYAATDSPIVTLTVNAQPETSSSTLPSNQESTDSPLSSGSSSAPSQETLTTTENQQTGEAPPVSVLASIVSIFAVSTVLPIYFKKHKR